MEDGVPDKGMGYQIGDGVPIRENGLQGEGGVLDEDGI